MTFADTFHGPGDTVVAHTSGSTGTPKAITLYKSDMRVSARATNAFFGIDHTSHLVTPLSTDYIAGKMMVVRALEARCRLTLLPPSNTPTLPDGDITLLAIVPTQLPALLPALQRVRHLLLGGAPLPQDAEAALTHPSAWLSYGMTETASHVALRRVGTPHYRALPGITFAQDPRGCLEIHLSGRTYSRVTTNDLVADVTADTFRWVGRADNVINSGGLKLHPELLEQQVRHPGEWLFTGRPSARWGTEMVCLVGPDTDVESLRDAVERALPATHRPKAYLVSTTPLPRTPSGKLRR